MSMIKNILMEKKFFESEQEVDEFLSEHEIEDGSAIHSLIFDRKVFKERAEATEWAANHYFSIEDVEESDDNVIINQIHSDEFTPDSLKTLEIRRGVSAVVGKLSPLMTDSPFMFKTGDTQNTIKNLIDVGKGNLKFSEDLPSVIEIAKTVDGVHPAFGRVLITREILDSFVRNFNEGVVGVDLSIDFDHETREAAGWIKELFLDIDGHTLLAVVKWTPKGALALSSKEFRYFSPEFSLNYVHPHTLTEHGPTLLGGGLVNRPFLKMDSIVGLKQKGELEMDTIKLSEHNSVVLKLEKEISDFKLSEAQTKEIVTKLKDKTVALETEVKTLKEEKEISEKNAKLDKLFSEEKINAAQLVALKEGKDFVEVLSLGEKLNLVPKGVDGENNTAIVLSAEEKALCAKLGLTDAEFISANGGAN